MSSQSLPETGGDEPVAEPTAEERAILDASFGYARNGSTDALVTLLSAGLPVNLTDEKGDTLLILAAYYGNADTVRALLSHGADANRENDRGQTALSAATFRCDEEVVRMLLDAGADPRVGLVSAFAVAQQFGLEDFTAIFDEG